MELGRSKPGGSSSLRLKRPPDSAAVRLTRAAVLHAAPASYVSLMVTFFGELVSVTDVPHIQKPSLSNACAGTCAQLLLSIINRGSDLYGCVETYTRARELTLTLSLTHTQTHTHTGEKHTLHTCRTQKSEERMIHKHIEYKKGKENICSDAVC